VAVLCIDLDGFKPINDSLGHAAGDEVLVAVAARLRAGVRDTHTVARLGGDEFAVLLEDAGSPSMAFQVAQRVLQALHAPLVVSGSPVLVGASIGLAVSAAGAERADELLRRADAAMYAAKRAGKGRLVADDPRIGPVSTSIWSSSATPG
jgi:diguanylate cyclase